MTKSQRSSEITWTAQLKLNGYSDDEIIEELACEIPELFLRNSKMIENLARRKPEVSNKIYDVISKTKQILNGGKTYVNADGLTLTYEQLRTAERLWQNGIRAVGGSDVGDTDVKYAIKDIVGNNANYGEGVYLDTDLFDNVKRNKWGKVLSEYVYNNLAGSSITVYDDNGQPEIISFANRNERVRKDGVNNGHRVIDKLARANADVKGLSIVHIDELLQTATNAGTSAEHTHQWLDENGWDYRKTYIQTKSGGIYEVTLNIANAKDGRKILYALSNIKRVDDGVVPSAHKVAHGSHISINSDDNISYNRKDVNRENQIKSENFKKWFGDWENDPSNASKVVNEDGSPKVVYHGTENFGFTSFDLNKMDDKRSIFLTDNPKVAQTYSGTDGVRKLADYDAMDIEKVSEMSFKALADELNKNADEYIRYEVFLMKCNSGQSRIF